jgi:hypothetical protein
MRPGQSSRVFDETILEGWIEQLENYEGQNNPRAFAISCLTVRESVTHRKSILGIKCVFHFSLRLIYFYSVSYARHGRRNAYRS